MLLSFENPIFAGISGHDENPDLEPSRALDLWTHSLAEGSPRKSRVEAHTQISTSHCCLTVTRLKVAPKRLCRGSALQAISAYPGALA